MKIIFVANTDWYLYNFRRSLAHYLVKQQHSVVMVSPSGSFVSDLIKEGFHWIPWKVERRSLNLSHEINAINQLRKIYKEEQPDLVHHFTMKPVLYGSISARICRVPRIVNGITGLGYIFLSKEPTARMLRPVVNLLFRIVFRTDRCQAIFENEYDRQYFQQNRFIAYDRTFLIAGVGVDAEKFSPVPEPDGQPVVLFPSRMLWDKGVGVVVEAARLLKNRVQARVVLVGEPDPGNPTSVDEIVIQKWVQEGLVEYWGWRDHMEKIYQQSHIVVLPSLYEGVPTVLLEAASCGRPIVATDIPGCRALVRHGENGYLVPLNDAGAVADALERLIHNKELRQKMGEAGRQIILDNFTNESINLQTAAVYGLDQAGS